MTYTTHHEPGEFGEGATVASRSFPIRHDDQVTSIPWDVIKPHEVQALRNHRRTLDQLAMHGGLTPCEALAVIEGRPWERMAFTDARRRLLDYVRGATEDDETVARLDAATAPDALNLEDLRSCVRMVEDLREGLQHPTRWNCNRLITTLERVRGRIEEAGK